MRLFAAILTLALASPAASADIIAGHASIIDAGTIQINGEVIRILDIDAPGKDQYCVQAYGDVSWECGVQATAALIDWIGQAVVTCETDKLDRYRRHLARCTVDGEDMAAWLAETGWAVPYGDCECEMVRAATARAQQAERGIWIGAFILPWE